MPFAIGVWTGDFRIAHTAFVHLFLWICGEMARCKPSPAGEGGSRKADGWGVISPSYFNTTTPHPPRKLGTFSHWRRLLFAEIAWFVHQIPFAISVCATILKSLTENFWKFLKYAQKTWQNEFFYDIIEKRAQSSVAPFLSFMRGKLYANTGIFQDQNQSQKFIFEGL